MIKLINDKHTYKQKQSDKKEAVELNEKADYYKEKAARLNTAISSDDEQAIPKLKKKPEELEHKYENIEWEVRYLGSDIYP